MLINTKKQETNQQTTAGQVVDYNALNFRAPKSKHSPKAANSPCKLTIVNTIGNGKRITIADDVLLSVGADHEVQIAINDEGIAIGSELPGDMNSFTLRKAGKKGVVYSTKLVEELTELFELNFSGKSSISFSDMTYLDNGDQRVAYIVLKQQGDSNDADIEPLDNTDPSE